MFQHMFLLILIPQVTSLRCMQCNSDSYEMCRDTQQVRECKDSDTCYSLTYASRYDVHGTGAIKQGFKRGCTARSKGCNECNFFRVVMNKNCKIKCCHRDYCNAKSSKTVSSSKKKRSSSEMSNEALPSYENKQLVIFPISFLALLSILVI